jgi:tRNA nucleotidyltransferase (CCA-adding enzyme)
MKDLARIVQRAGGRAWVVGGAVRDAVLGLPVTDLDVEVHGIAADELERLLAGHFRLDTVGQAFGVLKLRGLPIDVSLPRRESKAGLGHRGFLIASDPHLGLPEAAARRDFTMNAMAFDPLSGELVDPFDGRTDLARHRLRHCSPAFVEDPLRVLRGMQFAARFDLLGDPDTVALCRTIEPEGLAPERVWHEWRKLLLLGRRPSAGLRFLRDSGWLRHFPALAALDGFQLDARRHPAGDAYDHTAASLDVFASQRLGDEGEDLVVGLAVLAHALGRPHQEAGERPDVAVAEAFLQALTGQSALVRQVSPLVAHLHRPEQLLGEQAGDAAVRRLSRDVGRIDRLVRVLRACQAGRGPAGEQEPFAARWLVARAAALDVLDAAPPPIIQGRHLLARGLPPGPWVGDAIRACHEAQIDGVFHDVRGGLVFLDEWLRRNGPRPDAADD